MHESRFLCLAVSRRDGGNCIAGIDLPSGKWIRPVNPNAQGAFADHELIVAESDAKRRRIMAPLDVLNISLDKQVGDSVQPENWTMTPKPFENPYVVSQHLDRCSRITTSILGSYLDQSDSLLHSHTDWVAEADVRSRPLSHSLSLIEPTRLHWRLAENRRFSNRLQVRADFVFAGTPYCLVVTDPNWEAKCRSLGLGRHPHSKLELQPGEHVYLTVSLAGVSLHGYHYKLVAAVITLLG